MTRMPHTIEPSATLQQAHELMRKYQIRHLPVMENDNLVGVVSLGDLHLLETLKDVDMNVPVADAMSEKPVTVSPSEPLDAVAAQMADKRISSVVVVIDDGEVQGIFTNIDALTALLHVWKKTP